MISLRHHFLGIVLLVFLSGCDGPPVKKEERNLEKEVLNPEFESRPNILWIVAEDLSPYLPSFGDSTISTPHLSKLAAEGVCYDNFFSPHPVCAPARAAIITGMYANSIGASHMRTGPWFGGRPTPETLTNYKKAMPEDIAPYEAVPPSSVRMFTEFLRKNGYYCTNNSKEDYQFIKTPTAWDDSSNSAHWRNRASGQPFFSVFNIGVTHESQVWQKQKDSLWIDQDLDVPVPPYLPDSEIARNDIRRMYSNIKEMDARVGEILLELEKDGLLDNTVVFWYTDHGGPLPRQKRLLYDSGLKVPMIIRFPNKTFAGRRDHRLISFIDLAPTVLSLASISPPSYMQGQSFLGTYVRSREPNYVFGAADRFDETTDRIRSARDERFKYIRYYEPEKPMFLEVSYRNQMPVMKELLKLRDEGHLTPQQALWFRETKPDEELFDLWNDPHELNNLAGQPEYEETLKSLRKACHDWTEVINDTGLIEEKELIARMHPDGQQVTDVVTAVKSNNEIILSCATEGASIGYKIIRDDLEPTKVPWTIYVAPVKLSEGETLMAISQRLGYDPSAPRTWTSDSIH